MRIRVLLAVGAIFLAGAFAWPAPECCHGHHGHGGGMACCQGDHAQGCCGMHHGVGGGAVGAGMRYDPATVMTLRGTAVAVTNLSGGVHVTLQADGRETDVHLGPSWFVENAGVQIAKGDSIEVTGSAGESDGGAILIAREVKKGAQTVRLRDEQGVPDWSGRRRP